MEVSAYCHRGAKTCGLEGASQALSEDFWRAEQAFGAGDVEDAGGCIGQGKKLDAGRELSGALEQDSAGFDLSFSGALEEAEVDDGFGLEAGHAERCAFKMGVMVERAEDLHGRTAIKDGDGQGFELGSQAEQALGRKFGSVDAGVEMGFHAGSFVKRLAIETLAHEAFADHVDRGGLRAVTRVGANLGKGECGRSGALARH